MNLECAECKCEINYEPIIKNAKPYCDKCADKLCIRVKPWEKRKNIAFKWKCKGKVCYSPEEFEELKNNGPVEHPENIVEALRQYEDWPSQITYETLKEMYLAIPQEDRRFCLGNMDSKDWPIREALELDGS